MYSRKELIKKFIYDLVLVLIGGAILGSILYFTEMQITINRQKENSALKLDMADQKIINHTKEAMADMQSYNNFSQAKVDVLAYYYQRNPEKIATLAKEANQWELTQMYILNSSREIVSQYDQDNLGIDSNVLKTVTVEIPVISNNVCYYISPMDNGQFVLAGRYSASFLESIEEMKTPKDVLSQMKIGVHGYIMSLNEKGNISYSANDIIIGESAISQGFTQRELKDGYNGWVTVNSRRFYATTKKSDNYTLIALAKEEDIQSHFFKIFIAAMIIYAIISLLIVIYIHFIRVAQVKRDDNEGDFYRFGCKYILDKDILHKISHVLIVGIIFTFGASYFMQSLSLFSSQLNRTETKLDDIQTIINYDNKKMKELEDEYNNEYIRRLQNLAIMLQDDPSLVNDDSLSQLAKRGQMWFLYIFNENGQVTATNSVYKQFSLSQDKKDQSYEFWDIVKGYKDIIIQEAQKDDTAENGYVQYLGVKRLDSGGMLQAGMSPQRLEDRLSRVKLENVLKNIAVENKGMTYAINSKTKKFIYYPIEKYIGRKATKYGVTVSSLNDDYSGYQTVLNKQYFVSNIQSGDNYIYVAAPVNTIMDSRLEISIIVSIASMIIFITLSALALVERQNNLILDDSIEEDNGESTQFVHEYGSETKLVQSLSSRFAGNGKVAWLDRTPEQKLKTVIVAFVAMVCVGILFYVSRQQNYYDQTDILSYIVHLKWDYVPSLFSFTYIGILLIETAVFTTVVRKLIDIISNNLGARAETIARLLNNFIKYFSVIGVVMYSMNFIGVNSSAVLASAGIFTLVIGLGAQSMISDILAGIFIVFEGEFRVGDIITVGTWRGTVLEIGIRATKIQDADNNIKIINNSSISNVINMTKEFSIAYIDVGIDYSESLVRVENILEEELPKLKDKLPAIEDGPYYKGVVQLADSSVVIRMLAQCSESNRVQLTRDLNREIKLIFDRYNVNIPFPQVVVNKPAPKSKGKDSEDEVRAQEYVEKQKEDSKNIFVNSD